MEEKGYSVSEAVRLIGVESHVLRYWEEELSIVVRRNAQGHRIYSEENIDTFRQVRKLKEKGLQLKAIRLLLDKQGRLDFEATTQDDAFAEQIRELAGGETIGETGSVDDESEILCGEIIPAGEPEPVQQFEQILRRLMEEVVSEQNEKLEEAIADCMKEELTDFYLQYSRIVQEAAATAESRDKRAGTLRRWFRKLLRRA